MPGQVTFAMDDSEFQKVMGQYINASSKDAAFAMNRTMNNLAIFGVTEAKNADKSEIESIESRNWWPRYIGMKIANYRWGGDVHKRGIPQIRKNEAMYFQNDKLKKRISKQVIRSRSAAVSFMKYFFKWMSDEIRQTIPGLPSFPSKKFKGFQGYFTAATMDRPIVSISVAYEYKHRSDTSVKKAENILQSILDKIKPLLIADMRQYIARKMRERSVGISAR
jgi:hypothetical protein